jgi:hypothetical protein
LIHKADLEKGTWQFAAARLLLGNDHEPPHNREDDLESFYYVLNWMALRYSSHSLNSQRLTSELQRIFDYSYRSQSGTAAGGQAKLAEVLSGASNKLATFKNRPLAKLLEAIRKVIAIRYQDEPDIEAGFNRLPKVKRHELTFLFAKALAGDQDWDADGAKVDHKLVDINPRLEKKRKSEIPELYHQPANLPIPNDNDEHLAKRRYIESSK